MTSLLVDGEALIDGTGIGTFLQHLLPGLADLERFSVRVMTYSSIPLPSGIERVTIRRWGPGRLVRLEHEILRQLELRRVTADVFHSPAFHPPRRIAFPWVQTLHDLIPLSWPHPRFAALQFVWSRMAPRLHRAAAVASDSRFSADEGIRRAGLDPARVHVIPLGVDHSTFCPDGAAHRPPGPPYLLHVGNGGPHKGYAEAVAVHARLCEGGHPHRLVLAGRQSHVHLPHVEKLVGTSPWAERIEITGFVDDLADLYRRASALLVTSRCEGFCLPPLEAMACGTPVVAFANSSIPEVIGDGGILVPDGDTDAMVAEVRRLLDVESARVEASQAGLARARTFTWDRTVAAYAELFSTVAG